MQPKHIYTINIEKFKEQFNITQIKAPFIRFEGVPFPIETGKIETYSRIKQLDKYIQSHKNQDGIISLEVVKETTLAEDLIQGLDEAIEHTKTKKKKSKEIEKAIEENVESGYEMNEEEKEWTDVFDDVVEED